MSKLISSPDIRSPNSLIDSTFAHSAPSSTDIELKLSLNGKFQGLIKVPQSDSEAEII